MRHLLSFALLLVTLSATAEEVRKTIIRGKEGTVVTHSQITLSDVAEITSDQQDAQITLSNIKIAKSPQPGQSITLTGEKLLSLLKEQGVDLTKVGYLFPLNMEIRRASRTISEAEVQAALDGALQSADKDSRISQIVLPKTNQVYTGAIELQANFNNSGQNGQTTYALTVRSQEGEEMKLEGRALLDSWKNIPVATKSLRSGSVLEAGDIGLARLNAREVPRDTAITFEDLIGKRIQRDVNTGQTFRMGTLDRPPVVKAGTRVLVIYQSGNLEATARGVAAQDGFVGDIIEVRNEASKRLIEGRVKEAGVVEVVQ